MSVFVKTSTGVKERCFYKIKKGKKAIVATFVIFQHSIDIYSHVAITNVINTDHVLFICKELSKKQLRTLMAFMVHVLPAPLVNDVFL